MARRNRAQERALGQPGAARHRRQIDVAGARGVQHVLHAPIIVKAHADAFLATTLADELARIGATQLILCGMMTHNCVTHTAISKTAERYAVAVAGDACTSVSEPVHLIALNALADRVRVAPVDELV